MNADDRDTGALLAESPNSAHWVQNRIVDSIDVTSPDWLGTPQLQIHASNGRATLRDVVGDFFHQGIEVAPRPWGYKLFLFNRLPDGQLENALTKVKIGRLTSPRLRPFSNAKKVSPRVPIWCEPVVRDRYLFTPDINSSDWFNIDSLKKNDPGGWRIGQFICNTIVENPGAGALAHAFAQHAANRELRFHVLKGFRDESGTLICASKASPTSVGQGQGRAWRTWVNLEGNVIPVSGFHLCAPSPDIAAALVAWMSIDELIVPLMLAGQAKTYGSMQFSLASVASWSIPDLRADRLQPRLNELYAAFLAYREDADKLTPNAASVLPSYREAQRVALSLWRDA